MLQNTFCHLPSVSVSVERRLWEQGILSWEDALRVREGSLEPSLCATLRNHLPQSMEATGRGDLRYFAELLPPSLQWRLYGAFRDRSVYLDIETTGLGRGTDHVTTIVTYDGLEAKTFIHGQNLDAFPAYMETVDLLVTFNGKSFDLPFLERQFGVSWSPVHLDLRYLLRNVGITGGLKRCERQLGLDRKELRDVDGYTAVLLWQEYRRRRNPRALETLLAYNYLDVLNLEPLMVTAYNRLVSETPFGEAMALPLPLWQPENPYRADAGLLESLRGMIETRRGGGGRWS